MTTVILPTFNRAHVLARAVESVLAQDFEDWELIIADDGSTDGTPAAIERWLEQHAKISYLPNPKNRGVSAARNHAARHAKGRYLAFLDSDDEWLPNKLSRQMQLAPNFGLIHGEEIWIRNGIRVNSMKKHAKSGGRIFTRCVDLCCISPSATLMHRDLFESLGGFREDFPVCEDYELWLRVCAQNEIGFVAQPVLKKYGGHDDQLSRKFKAMDYYRVKALAPFLDHAEISAAEREHVARTIQTKCAILQKGYRKHGQTEHYDEVEGWARRALTLLQMAHSAADRRPRSESSFTR